MIELIMLILVVTMALLKTTLDPSWLNKVISLLSLSIILPILMIEITSVLKIKVYEENVVAVMIVCGMSLMTIMRDVYHQVKKMNTSTIEN